MKFPLTIGILSWGARDTLRHTLESYKERGLLDLAAQVFIFFQEMSVEDIELAREFGVDYYGVDTNIGIAEGYKAMLEYVEQPYYLFLENDWAISDEQALVNLDTGMGVFLLATGAADVVRYRSRLFPGNPLWTLQFRGNELSRPEHLLDSVHWLRNPDQDFPDKISKKSGAGFYTTTSRYANWTNNPHMVRTDWIKQLAPKFTGDIERNFQEWWQEQDFKVAQGEGIFTHWRL